MVDTASSRKKTFFPLFEKGEFIQKQDDEDKSEDNKCKNCWRRFRGCSMLVAMLFASLAATLTFMVFLAKFAFDNPNPPCWVVEAKVPYLTGVAPIAGAWSPGPVTDVHANFHTWFK